MKGISQEAMQHIIERPRHLDALVNVRSRNAKIVKMAETLKIMDKTQTIVYSQEEFEREFSKNKHYSSYLKKRLAELGIKKPRFIKDEGKVYIWKND